MEHVKLNEDVSGFRNFFGTRQLPLQRGPARLKKGGSAEAFTSNSATWA
jgi:hypothetical protein